MATLTDENPAKRPKVSHEDGTIIDLEESEDGNLEEDVELENQLRDAQADLDKIHEEMLSKLRQIEQEYEKKKAPFYKARGDVIRSIPGFWLHCFLQHHEIKHVIGDVDQQVLSALIEVCPCDNLEIAVEQHEDPKSGYQLSFKFNENNWFEDEVLIKSIHFVSDGDDSPQICYTTGCQPRWRKVDPTSSSEGEKTSEAAPFVSWLVSERTLEPGLVDTLADIIKDQLYVNPLEYLEGENTFEGHLRDMEEGEEDEQLLEEDLEVLPEKDAAEIDYDEQSEGDGEGDEPYDLDAIDDDDDAEFAGEEDKPTAAQAASDVKAQPETLPKGEEGFEEDFEDAEVLDEEFLAGADAASGGADDVEGVAGEGDEDEALAEKEIAGDAIEGVEALADEGDEQLRQGFSPEQLPATS